MIINSIFGNKLMALADCINRDTRENLQKKYTHCFARDWTVKVVTGNKYTKVDVGSSGKYMVDSEGNIYGIKGYGVIHRGYRFGTLDTINDYYWGEYRAQKKGGK